jgi:phage replication O-like protein O
MAKTSPDTSKAARFSDGFTQVPHALLDMVARTNLSPYETRILMVITRMTYGWHKEGDTIANLQFREATRINDRRNISHAVRKLESRRIIIVSRSSNHNAARYRINGNFSEWRLSSRKTTPNKARCDSTVVYKDDNTASIETAQLSSVETSSVSSTETPSEYIRKEIKEMKDTGAGASFPSLSSRGENSDDPKPASKKSSPMGDYLNWRVTHHEEMTYQQWLVRYG